MIRIFKVEFKSNIKNIVASNVKEAIRKATMKKNRTWIGETIHEIIKVELIGEANEK